MRTVIIEDELPAARALEKALLTVEPEIEILRVCDSVVSAVRWFRENPPPDLAFLDIQLGDGMSFEIFEKTEVRCPVVFVTAFDEYALRAFKLNSIDYLLKPVDTAELARGLKKFRDLHGSESYRNPDLQAILQNIRLRQPVYKSRFLIPRREEFLSIPVGEVLCFFSEHKNTYLVTRELKKHVFDSTLERIEAELDPETFFRANRQYLVAYPAIASVHSYFNGKLKIFLRGLKEEIIISRERAGEFKEWLNR